MFDVPVFWSKNSNERLFVKYIHVIENVTVVECSNLCYSYGMKQTLFSSVFVCGAFDSHSVMNVALLMI